MQFSRIFGQDAIKDLLISSVREQRVSHALLFMAAEGSGALPMALAYTNYIACEQRSDTDSCGKCNACLKFSKLAHPDLHFSFPVNRPESDSSTPQLSKFYLQKWREQVLENPFFGYEDWVEKLELDRKVPVIAADEVHEVVKLLQLKSYESDYKFLILWLPEFMNATGANRILKTLEEPPDKTVIILITQNQDALLPTILSRTQQIRFPLPSADEAAKILQNLCGSDEESCKMAVQVAGRNVARARRLLEHGESAAAQLALFRSWMQACYSLNVQEMLRLSEQIAKESRDWQKGFLDYALYMIRQAMLQNHSPQLSFMLPEQNEFIGKFRKFFHPQNYAVITGYINEAGEHIDRNGNGKIVLFDLSLLIAEVFRKEKSRAEATV